MSALVQLKCSANSIKMLVVLLIADMLFVYLLYVLVLRVFAFQDGEYNGTLIPHCARNYFQNQNSRLRNFRYYHEVVDFDDMGRSGVDADKALREDRTGEDLQNTDDAEVEISWRIVGGSGVSIRQIPYMVLYGLTCGGALIAPEWAITAAHCKEKRNFIYVGSTRLSRTTPYLICAHFTHPEWRAKKKIHYHDFDYQLLLLEIPVPVTQSTRPIAIGELSDLRPGNMAFVSGWGHTSTTAEDMEDILRRVSVPIIPFETCKNVPQAYYHKITPRMFCAGYVHIGKKDACQGDSGGPAVVNRKLVGLVSFGVGCAVKKQPGVYSNLPLARDWIRSVTGLPL